jgi:transcriptional regulator with XRE-family HTH domain
MNAVGQAVGETIRFHRGRRDWSQERLAQEAGIAATSVVRLENGEVARPRVGTLTKIADALGIDPQELASFVVENRVGEAGPAVAANPGPFTAVYQQDEGWWVGYVEELPGANAQERTLEEARESLREAVADVLEANRELTRTEFGSGEVVREPIGA